MAIPRTVDELRDVLPVNGTVFMLRRARHRYSFHIHHGGDSPWLEDVTEEVARITGSTFDRGEFYSAVRTSDPQGLVSQLAIELHDNHYELRAEFI